MEEKAAAALAKAIVVLSVRNDTCLEDIHAGTYPVSKTGDYSDVKVVTPEGEVPWEKLSRISNEEMKSLMKSAVNNVYSILLQMDNPQFMSSLMALAESMTFDWDKPEENPSFAKAATLNLL